MVCAHNWIWIERRKTQQTITTWSRKPYSVFLPFHSSRPISSFSYLLVRKRFPRDCGRLAQALDFFATSMTRRTSREMTVRLGLSNVALQVRNVVFEEWDQIQCNGQRVFDSSKFQIDASSDVEFPPAPDNFSPFDPPSTPPFWDSQGSPIDNRGSR